MKPLQRHFYYKKTPLEHLYSLFPLFIFEMFIYIYKIGAAFGSGSGSGSGSGFANTAYELKYFRT